MSEPQELASIPSVEKIIEAIGEDAKNRILREAITSETDKIALNNLAEKKRQEIIDRTGVEITKEIPTIQRDISETWDVMGQPAQTVLSEKAGIASTVVGKKFAELTSVQQDNLRAVHAEARATQLATLETELDILHKDSTRMEGLRNSTPNEALAYIKKLEMFTNRVSPTNLRALVKKLNEAKRAISENDLGTAGINADDVLTSLHKYILTHPTLTPTLGTVIRVDNKVNVSKETVRTIGNYEVMIDEEGNIVICG